MKFIWEFIVPYAIARAKVPASVDSNSPLLKVWESLDETQLTYQNDIIDKMNTWYLANIPVSDSCHTSF